MYPQTYSEGGSPAGIAFDGTNLWVTEFSGNSVMRCLQYRSRGRYLLCGKLFLAA